MGNLGGGFRDKTRTVLVTKDAVIPVAGLSMTQEEADTRIILHAIYGNNTDGCDKLIVHCSDTDVIIPLTYFTSKRLLLNYREIWVRTSACNYMPVHELLLVKALSPLICMALPFVHSLSGRDTTSYTTSHSEKSWFLACTKTDITALARYAEDENYTLTEEVIAQARKLLITVYGRASDPEAFTTLAELRLINVYTVAHQS